MCVLILWTSCGILLNGHMLCGVILGHVILCFVVFVLLTHPLCVLIASRMLTGQQPPTQKVRSTLGLKNESLTIYSYNVGEGNSMGCDRTFSLSGHVHRGRNNAVLFCPCAILKNNSKTIMQLTC